MTVTWVLESNVFSEVCFDLMVKHLTETGIPYHVVRIIPFVHTVDGPPPVVEGPVVCYGSIGIQKLARAQGWSPGVWFDEDQFRSSAYMKLGALFLNHDARILPMSRVLEYLIICGIEEFFIKPNGDMKEFAGQVMQREDFAAWYKQMIDIGYLDSNDFDAVISRPKELGREFRVVVVGDKIASVSRVRPTTVEGGLPPEALAVVEEAINLYRPADVFVIDVAEVFEYDVVDWKIIEYNNFNSAGLYACSVPDVIDSINTLIRRLQ